MRIIMRVSTIFVVFFGVAHGFHHHSQVPTFAPRVQRRSGSQRGSLTTLAAKITSNSPPPGSELFPGKGPYIPSGLSPDEYSKIKKKEADRLAKMNFGAFGPRFKQTDTPDGDWMLMRSLWTNGFNAQPNGVGGNKKNGGIFQTQSAVARAVRNYFPALLLSLILVDTMATATSMVRLAKSSATKQAIWMMILRIPPAAVAAQWSVAPIGSIFSTVLTKTLAVKLGAVVLLSPVMNNLLEFTNRRKLWSPKRTIGVGVAISFGCLSIWACLVTLVRAKIFLL